MNWGKFSVIAASTLILATGCGSPSQPAPATVTVTSVSGAETSTAKPALDITLPDVTGKNAEIARTELEDLGLTKVELASANPKYSNVLLAKNWSVVGMEPAAGTVVKSDHPVILKVYKD
jgi:beta-lactam-binding protein with PASTA domain